MQTICIPYRQNGQVAKLLYLDLWAAGRVTLDLVRAFETSKPTPTDTLPSTQPHLLQQGHAEFNKASLLNSFKQCYSLTIQIHKSMEPILIQATISSHHIKLNMTDVPTRLWDFK